ncbi:hypothetical protein GQ55_2G009700 [Panicum hallii var. hallii]|uniref:Uncharacterized protein n=1 Tax=Panicum hallii var. hallii TaxID=1504633 RepID=A0A2T7EKA2_9POAL|nr:hypothetical protein GQ55_2G009700 [Panicum hallii var. hallii]
MNSGSAPAAALRSARGGGLGRMRETTRFRADSIRGAELQIRAREELERTSIFCRSASGLDWMTRHYRVPISIVSLHLLQEYQILAPCLCPTVQHYP